MRGSEKRLVSPGDHRARNVDRRKNRRSFVLADTFPLGFREKQAEKAEEKQNTEPKQ